MYKDDDIRLRHMLDAAHEVIEFAQGQTRVDLNGDRKLVLALVKDVEIFSNDTMTIVDVSVGKNGGRK